MEDINKHRRTDPERSDDSMPIDPRLQAPPPALGQAQNPTTPAYPHQGHRGHEQPPQPYQFPTSPNIPTHPQAIAQDHDYQLELQAKNGVAIGSTVQAIHYPNGYVPVPQHASELDAHYWKNMFLELGFGEGVDPSMVPLRPIPQYMDNSPHQQHQPPHQHQHQQHQQHHNIPQQHLTHPTHTHQGMHPQGQMHYHPMHPSIHQSYGH